MFLTSLASLFALLSLQKSDLEGFPHITVLKRAKVRLTQKTSESHFRSFAHKKRVIFTKKNLANSQPWSKYFSYEYCNV